MDVVGNLRLNQLTMKLLTSMILFAFIGCNTTSKLSSQNDLAGMWKLQRIERMDSVTQWKEDSWMKGGTGFILYDGKGHMAVQITPSGYTDLKWLSERDNLIDEKVNAKIDSLSEAELKAALKMFSSNYVYFANYQIQKDTNVIIHDRLSHSNPSAWNTKAERTFQVNKDTLIIQLKLIKGVRRLLWTRCK